MSETRADIVIVTALPEERDAMLAKLPGHQKVSPTHDDIRVYYLSSLETIFPDGSRAHYPVVVMSLLGMGRVQATLAAADAIRRWSPRYIVLVGIAGGVSAMGVQLGDILISDQIVDYELQKLTPKGPRMRWEVYRADPRLLNASKNLAPAAHQKYLNSQRPAPGRSQVHTGPLASGDKVIAFSRVLDRYREKWPRLLGVEMEAAGVATAAFQSPNPPGFFMVRAVSDLADEDKGSVTVDQWREHACDIAASYAMALLQSGPVPVSSEFGEAGAPPSQNIDVLESLAALQNQRAAEESTRRRYLDIDELPYEEVEHFTGRQEELESLVQHLQNGKTCHIRSHIFGMGGVGKTSLAIQALHEVKRRRIFPDGIIWYRVRDIDLTKVIDRFSALIYSVSLQPNQISGLSPEEKTEAFKREFKHYNILFVLDNADYPVDSVLSPLLGLLETFSVLVTSRQELPLPTTAQVISLGVLRPEESAELFNKLLSSTRWLPSAAKEHILELCAVVGHLPLALRLAAYYIRQNRCTIAQYLGMWKAGREKLRLLSAETLDIEVAKRNVSACFELSLLELSAAERQLFLWLGLFQADFTFHALMATLGDDFFRTAGMERAADRPLLVHAALVKLATLSLIDKLEGFGEAMRIYLHPLLVEFAVEKRGGDISRERQVIWQHYLESLKQDVGIVATEVVHIKSALAWKFNSGEHKEFMEYCRSVHSALFDYGYWPLLAECLELAIKAARFVDDEKERAHFTGYLGDLKVRQGDPEGSGLIREAIALFDSFIDTSPSKRDARMALFLRYLSISDEGLVSQQLARIAEGLAFFNTYKEGNVVHLLTAFADVNEKVGAFKSAYSLHQQAANYWKRSDDPYNWRLHEHSAVNCMLDRSRFIGELGSVADYTIEVSNQRKHLQALVKYGLPDKARALILTGDIEHAATILEELKRFASVMESQSDMAEAYCLGGQLLQTTGDFRGASASFAKACRLGGAYTLRAAHCHLVSADYERSEHCLSEMAQKWSTLSVRSRTIWYALSALQASRTDHLDDAARLAGWYRAYCRVTGDEVVDVGYPRLRQDVNMITAGVDAEVRSAEELQTRSDTGYARPLVFEFEPTQRLELPKNVRSAPLTVGELMQFCKTRNVPLPLYYAREALVAETAPAIFISGELARRITIEAGSFLPEAEDCQAIQGFGEVRTANLAAPADEDWRRTINEISAWCGQGSDACLIESLVWTLCLSTEDRFRILLLLKDCGADALPRMLRYRISGTKLDRGFAEKFPVYLIHQWRIVKSLLVLAGIERPPAISAFWGCTPGQQRGALNLCLFPVSGCHSGEPSQPEMSFADCVLYATMVVDGHLYKDRGPALRAGRFTRS